MSDFDNPLNINFLFLEEIVFFYLNNRVNEPNVVYSCTDN